MASASIDIMVKYNWGVITMRGQESGAKADLPRCSTKNESKEETDDDGYIANSNQKRRLRKQQKSH